MTPPRLRTAATQPGDPPPGLTVPGGAGFLPSRPFTASGAGTVLTVGVGQQFATIRDAVAAAPAGALILVQPGTYLNDFVDIMKPVTIAGAGGMVNLVATQDLPNQKGIFIVDASCEIDNISFQGGHVADALGGNGAGIRYQGGNMVLHNDAFIGNQDGILAGAVNNLPQNTIDIANCTFDSNGNSSGPNAGYTHNLYVSNGISALRVTGSLFERANVGHELKSRAASNFISGNIFYDGPNGTASYSIDLPNGGSDTIIGNVIEKGAAAQNNAVIHFGGEGLPYAGSSLLVSGNRLVNDRGANIVAVLNQTTLNATITGNEFDNFPRTALVNGPFTLTGNHDQTGAAIPDSASSQFGGGTTNFDFSGDSIAHNVTLTSGTGVRGGGGLLTVAGNGGHVTALGGSGGLNYQEAPGFGGSLIMTASSAHDTIVALGQDMIGSAGTDRIIAGSGNLSAEINGRATVFSGSGDNTYQVNGTASIIAGNGGDTVQVNNAGASAAFSGTVRYFQTTVQGGTCTFDITQGGAQEQATIHGGSVAMRVYGGGMVLTTAGGTLGTNIQFGAGTVGMRACGADTIHAGSGAETIIASGAAQIHAGAGALAVFGSGLSGAAVFAAGGTMRLDGDSGSITYYGGAAANTLVDVLSNTTLIGGTGLMNVTGGARQNIIGGSGGVRYNTASGADVITTAQGAHDTISFVGACAVTSNGTDTISCGAGNSTVTANGNAVITGSTGNAFYTLNGRDSLAAYGFSRVTVGAAAHDTVKAHGALTEISVAGGIVAFSEVANADVESATVNGAGATLLCDGAATQTAIRLGGQGNKAILGDGHFRVDVAASNTCIQAGTGHDSVVVWNGGGVVRGGAGTLAVSMNNWNDSAVTTIQGGAGAVNQSAGYGNMLYLGDRGDATLGGTAAGETIVAGAGNITLCGGGAGTNFTAGSGAATLKLTPGGGIVTFGAAATTVTQAGWGQAMIYDFNAEHGGGTDIIAGFRIGKDHLQFDGVSVTEQATTGGGVALTLSDGTDVILVGVTGWS